jgi:AcrR family transcriptional regulator
MTQLADVELTTEKASGKASGSTSDATKGTRERILDVALDLFIEKGFDKTSLREIAEQLGFTKAALYYHFESKDDILMALHMRLHEYGRGALLQLGEGQEPATVEMWGGMLEGVIEQMLANRKIFLLHERNQAALETLHRDEHVADHDDLQAAFRRVFTDDRVTLEDRVRMASAFGAVMGGLFLSGEAFIDVPTDDLGGMLRASVRRILQ